MRLVRLHLSSVLSLALCLIPASLSDPAIGEMCILRHGEEGLVCAPNRVDLYHCASSTAEPTFLGTCPGGCSLSPASSSTNSTVQEGRCAGGTGLKASEAPTVGPGTWCGSAVGQHANGLYWYGLGKRVFLGTCHLGCISEANPGEDHCHFPKGTLDTLSSSSARGDNITAPDVPAEATSQEEQALQGPVPVERIRMDITRSSGSTPGELPQAEIAGRLTTDAAVLSGLVSKNANNHRPTFWRW
ncbi:MAG: hypothetical protein DHS80DRAFT_21279 [Piptocephalis tieghemiana]|nr:MAG: hypothetical protein DHS80DRAFT_21279 [Piptocephalis tieghemiana]